MNPSLQALLTAHGGWPTSPAELRRRLGELHRQRLLADAVVREAAARLLLAGDTIAEVEVAQTLLLGLLGQAPGLRPLAALAFDRLRVLQGRPQKFGTATAADGRSLAPLDGATTDSERAKWGLPSLAELQRRVAAGDDPLGGASG